MRRSLYRLPGLFVAGSLAAVALSLSPTAAQALDQRIDDGIHHYIECFKFMVTDEASHIAFCSPSRGGEWFVPESEYGGTPPAPPPPEDNCEPRHPTFHKTFHKPFHKDSHKTFHKDTHKTFHKVVQNKPHKSVKKPSKKGPFFQMGNFHMQTPGFGWN